MKKIFLRAYYNFNFGDDLFIDFLLRKYNNCLFYIDNRKYKYLVKKYKNVKICSNVFLSLYNKILSRFNLYKYHTSNYYVKKSDAILTIGGSMFIEKSKMTFYDYLYDNYYKLNNNYYIIGANFGPYTSEDYLKKNEEFFRIAKDVCFRDIKSYQLFKKKGINVRYSPDIIFGYKKYLPKNIKEKDKLFISIINLKNRKELAKYHEQYINEINKIIECFVKRGYDIDVCSFCQNEGDEEIVNEISSNFPNKINCIFYRGDINMILNEMMESKLIIGTRFHSLILGIIMEKNILPISYSIKTDNLLEDLNFKGKKYSIKDFKNVDIGDMFNEKQRVKEYENLVLNSSNNFKIIDEYIKGIK